MDNITTQCSNTVCALSYPDVSQNLFHYCISKQIFAHTKQSPQRHTITQNLMTMWLHNLICMLNKHKHTHFNHVPELSSSLRIFSLTSSSHCCRICSASSLEQFSSLMLSMANSLSPGSSVPVLKEREREKGKLKRWRRETCLLLNVRLNE